MYLAYFKLFVQQIMIYFVYNFDMRVAQEENVHGNVHATILFLSLSAGGNFVLLVVQTERSKCHQ